MRKSIKLMRKSKFDAKQNKIDANLISPLKIFKFPLKIQLKSQKSLNLNRKFLNLTGHSVKSTQLILNHPRLNLNQFLTPHHHILTKIYSQPHHKTKAISLKTPLEISRRRRRWHHRNTTLIIAFNCFVAFPSFSVVKIKTFLSSHPPT